MRLDRYVSHGTGLSRSLAQRAIRDGRVQVAGAVVTDPSRHVAETAPIVIDGAPVATPGPRYYMLHKPAGYVCAASDTRYPTILELIDTDRREGLHVAGRLDADTTGLVLVTDDGDWSHRVTSPRHKLPKVYHVTLAEPLTDVAEGALRAGVQLDNEPHSCRPAAIERLSDTTLHLTITEGKYHQVKRMFAATGNHVARLHRVQIGALRLDPALAEGASRPLLADEIATVAAG
jgi:16S rRNA pseudouridine516 synthase